MIQPATSSRSAVRETKSRRTPRPAPGNAEVKDRKSGRVMLIEDEEFVIQALARSLSEEGHCVSIFRTTLSALKALRMQPEGFELIVADSTLPKFSELGLMSELLKAGIKAPVVILTGCAELNEGEMEDLNVLKSFGKPFEPTELSSILHEALLRQEHDERCGS